MRTWLYLLLLCLPLAAVHASSQADLFNKGMAAAEAGNWAGLAQVQQRLGRDYPLNVYFEYQQLRQQLPSSLPAQISTFREHYRDTPLAALLLTQATLAYAREQRWADLLKLNQTPPETLGLRCDYVMALVKTSDKLASPMVAALLQQSEPLPDDCKTLFGYLAEQKKLDRESVLLLMQQAFRHGQGDWLEQLGRYLPANSQQKTWLLKLYQTPTQLDAIPEKLMARQSLIALALARLAARDPKAALAYWQSAPASAFVDDSEKQQLAGRIAWYSSISSQKVNQQWLDGWLPTHPQPATVEQRARQAVREQDWAGLVRWIALLPVDSQQSADWQYWSARAQAELGHADLARKAFKQAATDRSFYGFLAARQLQLPYALNDHPRGRTEQMQLTPAQTATLTRVRLLLEAERPIDAKREWRFLLMSTDTDNYPALARYALLKHWYHLAIATAVQSGNHDQLSWRFPLAWKSEFEQAAKAGGRDDAWLMMAVARRESAFYPQAQSPVGALGLMQLMPATARRVAAHHGVRLTTDSLFDKRTNLKLGAAYLDGLLKRYQGNRVLALAAYNAGPIQVARWLGNVSVPADVWVEGIPFGETREYVKAVLAYRVIFMRLAGIADDKIDMLGSAARNFAFTSTALENAPMGRRVSENP